jgi:hypothetical protein
MALLRIPNLRVPEPASMASNRDTSGLRSTCQLVLKIAVDSLNHSDETWTPLAYAANDVTQTIAQSSDQG